MSELFVWLEDGDGRVHEAVLSEDYRKLEAELEKERCTTKHICGAHLGTLTNCPACELELARKCVEALRTGYKPNVHANVLGICSCFQCLALAAYDQFKEKK